MIIEALNALGINSEFCVDANVTTEEHYLRTYRDLSNENRFFEWSVVWAKMQELQAAEPMRLLRQQRNRLLAETDWRMVSDYPGSNQSEWQTYRQALRDITTQSPSLDSDGNLTGITWPTPPND
jgi:hypothetical protein